MTEATLPMFQAKVLADSISPDGVRLLTVMSTMPRPFLAEFNTHRVFSRNSASSRAIPVETRIGMIDADPWVPETFSKNQKGMQAKENVDEAANERARASWLRLCEASVRCARELVADGVHKQHANRPLELFSPHTVITTSTEWENFFNLRAHPDAQPEIQIVAAAMRRAVEESTPRAIGYDEWHLPLVFDTDAGWSIEDQIKLSCARCARVSYMRHDAVRDPEIDIKMYGGLQSKGHMAPLEHAATPLKREDVANTLLGFKGVTAVDVSALDPAEHFCGNLRGWKAQRKFMPNEAVFTGGVA